MYKLAWLFFSALFVVASPAHASDKKDKWFVSQLTGDARVVHPGAQPTSLKLNAELVPGDKLITGPNGRATLVHGADYIIVAPRTEMRLPSAIEPDGFTRVVQTIGTMLFRVQHTGIPHFAVDTPMLAAVVKGTTFTVIVDQKRSAVQVTQGVVQVTAAEGGMSRLVEGGRTVFIDQRNPKELLNADKPLPAAGAPDSDNIAISESSDPSVASIAQLTGGLVRAESSAPTHSTTPDETARETSLPIVAAALRDPAKPGTAPTPTTIALTPPAPAASTAPKPAVAVPAVTIP